MVKANISGRSSAHRPGRIPYIVASNLATALFVFGYIRNEYLNSLNRSNLQAGNYDDYDYLLGDSEYFIFALLVTLAMITILWYSGATTLRRRAPVMVGVAWLLYAVTLLSMLDLTFGGWGIPMECGAGFSLGNCFMLDGLGEMFYYASIPAGFILGTILLLVARKKGNR